MRASLVNVFGSKEFEIFSISYNLITFTRKKARASKHLPNIYQENVGLWEHPCCGHAMVHAVSGAPCGVSFAEVGGGMEAELELHACVS